jgi:hypothetical protein
MLATIVGIAIAVVCLGCATWWLTRGSEMAQIEERLDMYGR